MKVSVLGAGAVGSMLGALIKLHAPEMDVLLIARGQHGEMMVQQGGVNVKGQWGETHVSLPVSSNPKDLAGSDYVLLTVKSHCTEEAIRGAAEYAGDATVISIQNGINQPVLSRYVTPERLVMGMTDTIITISAPGTATMQRAGVVMIGPSTPHGSMDVVRDAAALLARSRHKVLTNLNVIGAQYNKLVFNTLGAASSLSESEFLSDGILYRPWRDAVAIPLQAESLEVLARAGVPLGRIPGGSDALRFRRLLRMLNLPAFGPLVETVVRRLVREKPIHFSLGTDLRRGKETEVDWINGEIVRLADRHGLYAPLNAKVVEMVHQLERRGGFFTRDEVISIFRDVRQSRTSRHATDGDV